VRKTEAFNRLGYDYRATRGVWSAERDGGVLMTIWQQEIRCEPIETGAFLYVDMNELHPIGSPHRDRLSIDAKPRSRSLRLKRALEDPQLTVDVVILLGRVGNSDGNVVIWRPEQQNGATWRPVWINDDNNFFRMETSTIR